jgi:hypothetical protein
MTLALLLGGTAPPLLLLLALSCADVPRAAVAPLSPAGGTFRVCFALGDAGGAWGRNPLEVAPPDTLRGMGQEEVAPAEAPAQGGRSVGNLYDYARNVDSQVYVCHYRTITSDRHQQVGLHGTPASCQMQSAW